MTGRMSRRVLLGAMPGAALALAAGPGQGRAADAVPWSAGTELPTLRVPALATDCHHHIYSARFRQDPRATLQAPDASVAQYRLLQARLGTTRNVVVQPSAYGIDNSGLVEALGEFGPAATRGVAVVDTDVSDTELRALDRAGVRGIRFNLLSPGSATSQAMIDPLSRRVAGLGWHIQLNMSGDQIAANRALWDMVPTPVVFDHLGHLPEPEGTAHPGFAVMAALMARGKGWVKLTGLYNDTRVGPPGYADSVAVATALVASAPGQVVWGTDWPHPTEALDSKPDDALLLDILGGYVRDPELRARILVDNPARLYGFPLPA